MDTKKLFVQPTAFLVETKGVFARAIMLLLENKRVFAAPTGLFVDPKQVFLSANVFLVDAKDLFTGAIGFLVGRKTVDFCANKAKRRTKINSTDLAAVMSNKKRRAEAHLSIIVKQTDINWLPEHPTIPCGSI